MNDIEFMKKTIEILEEENKWLRKENEETIKIKINYNNRRRIMNYNKYNEVINGEETYKGIAEELVNGNAIGIGWTDEILTHLDIIFKLCIVKHGNFQRGLRWNNLYVSIIDHTSYAFNVDDIKLGTYIQEKIRMNNECGDKVAELINGVILALQATKQEYDLK